MEQVVDRIRGESQLGKHHQRGAGVVGLASERERVLGVEFRFGDADVRHGGSDADEPVAVQRAERADVSLEHRNERAR